MGQPTDLLTYEKAVHRRTKKNSAAYTWKQNFITNIKVQKNKLMQNAETHSGQFFKVRQREGFRF
jgi:hypothetical protein